MFPSGLQFRMKKVSFLTPLWNAFCKQVNQIWYSFLVGESCQYTNIAEPNASNGI